MLRKLLELIVEDCSAEVSPFTAPLREVLALLEQTTNHLLTAGNTAEDGAYALLQLTGLAVHGWNGHALFTAAASGTHYQLRLRAALELHATGLADSARVWAGKAAKTLPAYRFQAF